MSECAVQVESAQSYGEGSVGSCIRFSIEEDIKHVPN